MSIKYGNTGLHDGTDDTKIAKFDVSGITTGTERTIKIPDSNCGLLHSMTAQASTSGTSIDFTSIPSWVKRITVMLDGVSTNGTSFLLLQLGDSGGIETSGYTGTCTITANSAAITSTTNSAGFHIQNGASAGYLLYGGITLSLLNSASNLWVAHGVLGAYNLTTFLIGGSKPLSATLDRVRITTVNGTDAFDAGTINVLYE